MRRALHLLPPLLLMGVAVPAYAQQATPEDFGVPQAQQPAPSATPPPPAQTTAPPPPEQPPPEDPKRGDFKPALKLQLGYQYSQLHGVPINAGRFRLGAGAQNDTQAHYFSFSSMVGATETDRRAWDLRFGYEGALRLAGIVRIGFGVETGYVFVRRASIDERMWALGIGANVNVGIDAVTWGPRDDHALYFEARIEGHIHFGNADMWGPTLSAGVRF